MTEFTAIGGVATPALIPALQANNGRWAHAVLGQSWGMPDHIVKAVLSGDAKCQIKNSKTLVITLPESP